MGLRVVGVDRTADHLREIGNRAEHLKTVNEAQARRVARSITGVPRGETGDLAASIGVLAATDHGWEVGSRGVPYARFVFRGTRNMAAQPPNVPAGTATQSSRVIADHVIR